jgi:hypothetical protein
MGSTAKARHRRRHRRLHDKQGRHVTWLLFDWQPRFDAYLARAFGGDFRAWYRSKYGQTFMLRRPQT